MEVWPHFPAPNFGLFASIKPDTLTCMSEEGVVCRYVFTMEEFRRSRRLQAWRRIRIYLALTLICLPLALCSFLIWDYVRFIAFIIEWKVNQPYVDENPGWAAEIFLSFFIPFSMVVLAAGPIGKQQFKKGPLYNQGMIYVLNREGLTMNSPLVHESIRWDAFSRAVESKYGFNFRVRGGEKTHWLSKDGFASPGDMEECGRLIRDNVKKLPRRLFGFELNGEK